FTTDTLGLTLTSSSTLNGPGAVTVGNRGLNLFSSTVNAALTDNGPLNINGTSFIKGPFSIGTTGVLTIGVTLGCANNSDLTVANGFTNQGQISLRSSFVCDRGTGVLRVSSGMLINDAGATIQSGGPIGNTLQANLDNRGTLDAVAPDLQINGA